jgi:hypothetical protein
MDPLSPSLSIPLYNGYWTPTVPIKTCQMVNKIYHPIGPQSWEGHDSADPLSWAPLPTTNATAICNNINSISHVQYPPELINQIKAGYKDNKDFGSILTHLTQNGSAPPCLTFLLLSVRTSITFRSF